MALSLITAPDSAALDVEEAKEHLRVDTDDEDNLIGVLAAAVSERAELATQRALRRQTWDYVLDAFPAEGFIEIPKPPLVSVTYVKYTDMGGVLRTLTANTDYLVQAPAGPRCKRGRVALPFAGVWPIALPQMGAVTVRFVAGYATLADVPSLLQAAMKMDLGNLYENREAAVLDRGAFLEVPFGTKAIYWSYKSHATQRVSA